MWSSLSLSVFPPFLLLTCVSSVNFPNGETTQEVWLEAGPESRTPLEVCLKADADMETNQEVGLEAGWNIAET